MILSFKRAFFPGNDQSCNNEIGKWLRHSFGLHFLCPSDVEDSFYEDVHNVCPAGRSPLFKYADYLFEFKLCNIPLEIPSRNVGLNPIKHHRTNTAEESFHAHFNAQFYTAHPTFFVFLDSLNQHDIFKSTCRF